MKKLNGIISYNTCIKILNTNWLVLFINIKNICTELTLKGSMPCYTI